MTKGEKSKLVFKQVYYMGVFLLSYNSRSSKTFIGSSCNLKPDGALILLMHYALILHAYSSLILLHACWISSGTIFHHAFQILHIIWQMHVWITRYRGRSPWFYSSSVHFFKSKFLTMHIFRVLLYLAIKFLNISIYTSYVHPRWKLNLYCHQSPKRGRL